MTSHAVVSGGKKIKLCGEIKDQCSFLGFQIAVKCNKISSVSRGTFVAKLWGSSCIGSEEDVENLKSNDIQTDGCQALSQQNSSTRSLSQVS